MISFDMFLKIEQTMLEIDFYTMFTSVINLPK